MLSTEEKNFIKATVPVLKEHGVRLTTHFYKRMFSHNPELKNVFNMGNQKAGKQQMALAMSILAYAENIDNPEVLLPAVNKIGQKHTSLGIRAEHYPIVGKHLIASISEVLGSAASDAILNAWANAYQELAKIFINFEEGLYAVHIKNSGGWTGWRPFIVRKKMQESEEITSFYLYPSDGGSVEDFKPGQYISINLFLPEINLFQARQYSLSNAPNGEFYRISVKKEKSGENCPAGLISNYLHDHVKEGDMVEISAPAGDFIIDTGKANPVVFISGGIGQTPLLSMLESLIKNNSKRKIVWVHGCRSCKVHAFDELIEKFKAENENLRSFIFYEDGEGRDCLKGYVEIDRCDNILLQGAEYYICGPSGFIKKQYMDLKKMGVDHDRIFFEEFGPHILELE